MCSSTPAPPPPPTSPRCSKPRTDCRRVWGRCEDRETSGCYRPPTLGERSRIPPAPRHVGPELLGHALLSKSSRGGSGSPSSGSSVPTVRDERAFWAHQVHAHLLNTIGAATLQELTLRLSTRGRGRVGRRAAAAVVIVLTEALANAVRHGRPAGVEV